MRHQGGTIGRRSGCNAAVDVERLIGEPPER
jgi:hypothetical protein